MRDLLLELGKRPRLRATVQRLGLPLPIPQDLERATGPCVARPLEGRQIALAPLAPEHAQALTEALSEAGARLLIATRDGDEADLARARALAPDAAPLSLQRPPADLRLDGLVLDASALDEVASLWRLHHFFHPLLGRLARCGRVLILGRPLDACSPSAEAAATQAALEGFTRSLARELGRRGATAQLVRVAPGAATRLPAVLRFLLSPRSAYISGQPFTITTRAAPTPDAERWVRPHAGALALVTGAAHGIGAATARRLAQEGARVICLDHPQARDPLAALADALDGLPLEADLSRAESPDAIADAIHPLGPLQLLIHNAGVTRDRTLARMPIQLWDQVLDVNLAAPTRLTDALLSRDLLRDHARVVCLSSVSGLAGNVGQTAYAASKSGLLGLVHHLASALAPRGITANAIAPGFIETRMTAAMPAAIREVARRLNSLNQGGAPLDVAEAVAFLAAPSAHGLTGQVVRVCGGALLGA